MRLRLTNEDSWTHEFDASDWLDLLNGVRKAWDAFIDAGWPGATSQARVLKQAPGIGPTHPGLAYHVHQAAIDRWLRERIDRPRFTEDARKSWRAQACLWTHYAKLLYGEEPKLLALHVLGPASGLWLAPAPGRRLAVPRRVLTVNAVSMMVLCEQTERHDRNLTSLAARILDAVRDEQYPELTLVKS